MRYVHPGLAFGGGVLVPALPVTMSAALADDASLLQGVLLSAMAASLGAAIFTTALMRLRSFPWRNFRWPRRAVAAALGVLSATLGVAGTVVESGAGLGIFASASLVSALVLKRVFVWEKP